MNQYMAAHCAVCRVSGHYPVVCRAGSPDGLSPLIGRRVSEARITRENVFYDGPQFPADWRGSAFVALKGSWNRSEPTGYKVVRVPFKNGRPEGSYENL